MKKVMIYSNEHGKWWAEDYCGYTEYKEKAGIFDYDKALLKYPYISYNKKEEDYFVDISDKEAAEILRDREIRRDINDSFRKHSVSLGVNIDDIDINLAKKLKAFEIIKNKKVHTRWLYTYSGTELFTVKQYNKDNARLPEEDLTDEEFSLLKEALCLI